jgi:hypothetical protein
MGRLRSHLDRSLGMGACSESWKGDKILFSRAILPAAPKRTPGGETTARNNIDSTKIVLGIYNVLILVPSLIQLNHLTTDPLIPVGNALGASAELSDGADDANFYRAKKLKLLVRLNEG